MGTAFGLKRAVWLWFFALILSAASAFAQTTVTSIAAMKALNATDSRNATVIVTGYYSANDGGGGTFAWNSTSTAATNYGTIFKGHKTGSELATGRWVRQIAVGTPYSAKWFGALGNGIADDTARIASAFATLPTPGILTLPSGTYQIARLALSRGDFTLRGPGVLRCSTTNAYFFSCAGPNVTLDGLKIDGNFRAASGLVAEPHSLNWTLTNIVVANCYIDNVLAPNGGSVADGVLVENGCQNFLFTGCTISNINHAAADGQVSRGFRGSVYKPSSNSIDYLKNFTFDRCTFDTISPNLEGDCLVFQGQTNSVDVGVVVKNCTFRNYGHRAGKFMVAGGTVVNCLADRSLTNTAAAYSGFSFYGSHWQCLSNRVTGTNPYGIETGSSAYSISDLLIADNTIEINTNGLPTSIGLLIHESCSGVLALRNSVSNALFHTQIAGNIRDSAFVASTGINIMSMGVLVSASGGIAPSNCSIVETVAPAPAKYGVRIDNGTNITTFAVAGNPIWAAIYNGPDVVQPTSPISQLVKTADYALQLGDLTATATSPLRFTLPDSKTAKPGKCYILRAASGVTVSTIPSGTDKISGATSDTIQAGAAKVYVTDGKGNWNVVNVTIGPT